MLTYPTILNDVKPEKELYYELGRTLMTQGKYRKAIEFLEEARLLKGSAPEDWEIFYLLGEGYRNLSKSKDAFQNYIEAAQCIEDEKDKLHFYQKAKSLISPATASEFGIHLKNKLDADNLSRIDTEAIEELLRHTKPNNVTASSEKQSTHVEIQAIVAKAISSIDKNEYKKALTEIEEALTKDPDHHEVLFLKLRIMIEGQLNLSAATALLNDDEYGYRKDYKDSEIVDKLHKILELEGDPKKGNSYFFAAFIGNLIDYDKSIIYSWLAEAERLGLTNELPYPEIGLYVLKGEFAEKRGDREIAGNNFLEAARRYYWQQNYTEAVGYLEKAIQLNPTLNEAYNYYADSMLMLSYQSDPPYYNRELVYKGFDYWHKSPKKTVDLAKDAWYYVVIARIHEARYKFETKNFLEEYWQAILYGERAVVHDATYYRLWTYLGMFYRDLSLEANSLLCLDKAKSLATREGDLSFVEEEKVGLQLDMGDFEEPTLYLQKLRTRDQEAGPDQPPSYKTYHKSWQAYIFLNRGQYKDAIELIEGILKEETTNLFFNRLKMFYHWQTLEFDKAKSAAETIIELGRKYVYLKEEFTFSWAHFISGNADKAITMLEDFDDENSYSLSQFYLYSGEIEKAKASFILFIRRTTNKRTLNEFIKNLGIFRSRMLQVVSPIDASVIKEIAQSWETEIKNKITALTKNPVSAWDELTRVQEEYKFKEGSVPYITIQTGLARLNRNKLSPNEKNLPHPYAMYHEISRMQKENALFPEARVVLEQMETEIYDSAASLIKSSTFTDAIALLDENDLHNSGTAWKKNMLLALAYFGVHNQERSVENIKSFVEQMASRSDVLKEFWDDITGRRYVSKLTWNFVQFMRNKVQQLNIPGTSALIASMNEDFWNVLMNKSADLYPIVTPIAVEISSDLVSEEADSSDWYVITELIPPMRERIVQQFGVKPPGVRIRANDGLTPGTYVIILDEIPLVSGTVHRGKLFVTDNEKDLQALGITGDHGWDPTTGRDSVWVNVQFKAKMNDHTIRYWEDPFDYIMAHLERVLKKNLEMFVDVQFCDDYLYSYPDGLADMAKAISSDRRLVVLFSQVLKGLAKEKVPLQNKESVIRSFTDAAHKYSEINDIIQHIRLALKGELPINRLSLDRFELPAKLEAEIKSEIMTEEGKTFLAMIPKNCQDSLSEIREILGKNVAGGTALLLTKDTQLRIHLRKLTELEFPDLHVASGEELMDR